MSTEQEPEPPMPNFPELPDWANVDVLETRMDEDYSDWHFAKPFAEIERPILTAPQIANRVGASENTTRDRLGRLVNNGFLEVYELAASEDKSSKTKIYWLRHPEIRDPIPTELSGDQINDLTRLNTIETENKNLRERVDRKEQELQAQTEEAETYEQTLRRISIIGTVAISAVLVLLIVLVIPLAVVDGIQSAPLFFRALAQPTVAIALGLIVAVGGLYLISLKALEGQGGRPFRDMLG